MAMTLRVLLVEDSAADAAALAALLPAISFRHVTSLAEAARAGELHDVLLLDLDLPGSRGLATLARALEELGGVPIVALVSGENLALGEECIRCGAVDYLARSWRHPELIRRTLAYAHERHRARTERARLELELRQAQKMEAIGRLAGGVAHDFNNLLTAIFSFGSFAIDGLAAGDPARSDIEEVLKAAERARLVIQHLLAFLRRKPVEPRIVDVNQLVTETERLLRHLLGEDIDLRAELAGDLWKVRMDAGALEQILVNLAVNARDAMPTGGSLVIETANEIAAEAAPGEYVAIRVSDSGAGIPAEVRQHLFEPFFTTKEGGKGTGLGLATCQVLVGQADGRISVESERGRGTTFRILLPRAAPGLDPVEPAPAEPAVAGHETVLLVEDDEEVRSLSARALRRGGYRVLEASNGGEALLICEDGREQIDLLVTDVIMPRMSGSQLAARLACGRAGLKVLYMSGYTAAHVASHLPEPVELLEKPFTPQALLARVRTVLDG